MKKRYTLISILLVVIVTLTACFVGHAIGASQMRGSFINWQLVQLPNMQRPDHFVLGEGHVAYVKTTEGNLLSRPLFCTPDISWHEVEGGSPTTSPSGNSLGHCALNDTTVNADLTIRNPPGTVVEQLDCLYRIGADGGGCNFRFVILSNGELWSWRHSPGWQSVGNYCAITSVFLVTGSTFGFLLSRFLKRSSVRIS